MNEKFPFAFDMSAFKMPTLDKMFGNQFPVVDFSAVQDMQKKNFAALLEANKTALAGYQNLFERQTQLFEAALAETKDRLGAMQGQPMSVETAQENYETLKTAIEKAMVDFKELAEIAQTANTDAFEIIKTRAEAAFAEMKDAAEKLAA